MEPNNFGCINSENIYQNNSNTNLIINNNNNNNNNNNDDISKSPFKEDHVSVFMGGFAQGTTTEQLKNALHELNVKMIECSGISYRNYGWSFVTLANSKQAEYLINISPITIGNRSIDIRPFINRRRVRNHNALKPPKQDIANIT